MNIVWGEVQNLQEEDTFTVEVNGLQWYWDFYYLDEFTWEDMNTGHDVTWNETGLFIDAGDDAVSAVVKWGKPAFSWEMRGSQNAEGELLGGQLKLVELTAGETATVTVKPARGIDLGAGPGNPVAHEVTGGSVGLILDARGRPIALPESRDEARDVVAGWYRELNIIDEGDA